MAVINIFVSVLYCINLVFRTLCFVGRQKDLTKTRIVTVHIEKN